MSQETDETELKDQLARTLANQTRLAALGQLTGGIAHEINNPLMVVTASATMMKELLAAGALDAARLTSVIEKLERSGLKISEIVRRTRAFARDATDAPPDKVELDKLLIDALDLIRPKFKSAGVEMKPAEGLNPAVYVVCRPGQLQHAVVELLGNACEAVAGTTDPWAKLSVASVAAPAGTRLEIRVFDSGPGIAAEARARLFEAFYTTKPPGKGVGLGLFTARAIVAAAGGELAYEEGPNTAFLVRLPAA